LEDRNKILPLQKTFSMLEKTKNFIIFATEKQYFLKDAIRVIYFWNREIIFPFK